jgi:hypothetical protein
MSSATLAARTAHSVWAGWPRFNSWQENNSFLQKCGSDGLLGVHPALYPMTIFAWGLSSLGMKLKTYLCLVPILCIGLQNHSPHTYKVQCLIKFRNNISFYFHLFYPSWDTCNMTRNYSKQCITSIRYFRRKTIQSAGWRCLCQTVSWPDHNMKNFSYLVNKITEWSGFMNKENYKPN